MEQDTSNNSEAAPAEDGLTDAQTVADAVANQPTENREWFFDDKVPGVGEPPEWFKVDKYKTVAAQAKAYKDLEKKFGSFIGAPESYEPPELNSELKEMGIEIAADDPLMGKAIEFAKDSGMNQEGFNKMINLYAETMAAEQKALEDYKADQLKALGPTAETRINNLNAWAAANLPETVREGFNAAATTAEAVTALERIVAMTRSATINPANGTAAPALSADEVKAMQFEKDQYGNRRIHVDPEFRKKFEAAAKRVYGDEPTNNIM